MDKAQRKFAANERLRNFVFTACLTADPDILPFTPPLSHDPFIEFEFKSLRNGNNSDSTSIVALIKLAEKVFRKRNHNVAL